MDALDGQDERSGLLDCMGGGTVLWDVTTGTPSRLALGVVGKERDLEDWIEHDPSLIGSDLVILARQLAADGKPLDLLALDADGNLVVIELKRGDAYRDALAQGIDYTAWIAEQSAEQLSAAVDKNRKKDGFFNETVAKHIGAPAAERWSPQDVDVRLVVAGTGADDRLRRMIGFLSKRGVSVNGVFFDIYVGPSNAKLVARTSVLTDEEVEQTERRGRGRGTSLALLGLAEANGTKRLVVPLLDGWRDATGREARPELYSWTLPAMHHGGRTVGTLWPGHEKGTAWVKMRVTSLATNSGHADADDRLSAAGLKINDGHVSVAVTDDVAVNKFVAIFKELYAPRPPDEATAESTGGNGATDAAPS